MKNYSFKGLLITLGLAASMNANAQDARVQIIHNSADAATASVDIFAGASELYSDVDFRTATPFFDLPGGTYTIGLAVASGTNTAADTVKAFDITVTNGETYIVMANGIVSGTGYSPAPALTLDVFAMGQEEAVTAGNTDVLVFHGSTDAPTVDVETPGSMTPLVDDASYGDYAGYLNLPTDDYTLNVTDQTGATVVKSYQAPLATLGLEDSAVVVIASGFLDPSQNSGGPDFGLWVALPEGGALVELPESTGRLQVIHNSADAAASEVDVYFNDALLIDNFAFRTASAYIDVPAEVENTIGIAPSNSNDTGNGIDDTLVAIPATFMANETYVAIANGIISASGYTPATPFSLDVFGNGREEATTAGNTDVLVFHGSTDAPAVDVAEVSVPAGTIVDDMAYGEWDGYIELATADYILEVQDVGGTTTVASYSAPLQTLGLEDSAIVVVASGFLDPAQNSNGPAFGLWVALPEGDALIELPTAFLNVDENTIDFSVYPNPTDNWIRVEGLTEAGIATIFDLSGKIVYQNNVQNLDKINVSNLETGNYILQINTANGINQTKVAVK